VAGVYSDGRIIGGCLVMRDIPRAVA
jgi:hypothetical protein